ncbi:MAG: hypoxanthine phosphoribosyltransferase [Flavobacteriales bacterium]|jgi:hypoxanthine phosphoribosyltransferase
MQEIQVLDKQFVRFIEVEKLQTRIEKLGEELSETVGGRDPLFLVVLNGAAFFAVDLLKEFKGDCKISFVKYSSYQGLNSQGTVKQLIGLNEEVKGRLVVIVEDIVETGLTVDLLSKHLLAMEAEEVLVCSLLHKPSEQKQGEVPEFVGFSIEKDFVVGYGLDYNGYGRNSKAIYKLKEN